MNANYSNADLIFRDQPLANFNPTFARRSSLNEACREPSDVLDASLRAVLILCMVVALLVGGWHVSTSHTNTIDTPAQSMVAAQGFSVNGQHTF